jgi:hypothetical protein
VEQGVWDNVQVTMSMSIGFSIDYMVHMSHHLAKYDPLDEDPSDHVMYCLQVCLNQFKPKPLSPGCHVSDASVGHQLSPRRHSHLRRTLVHDTHIPENSDNRHRHGSSAQSATIAHVVRAVV